MRRVLCAASPAIDHGDAVLRDLIARDPARHVDRVCDGINRYAAYDVVWIIRDCRSRHRPWQSRHLQSNRSQAGAAHEKDSHGRES